MKDKLLCLAVLLAAFAGSALAQTQFSGSSKCDKANPSQSIEVGDHAGHIMIVEKGTCTWNTPVEMAGLTSKTYTSTDTVELNGAKAQIRGYVVMTMDNGDKAFIRFQGSGTTSKEGAVAGDGTWSYTGGTGKLKGIHGKGTYKNSGTPDGPGETHVEGEYSLPEPGAVAKKK